MRTTPRRTATRGGGHRGPLASVLTCYVLGGVTYAHGIGTRSINELIIDLKGQATRFLAMVGLNDNASKQGSVTVEVWLDNRKVLISDVLRVGSPPLKVGREGRREFLADDRRPDRRVVEHGGGRLQAGRPREVVEAGPLDGSGHARDRQRSAGARTFTTRG